MLRLDSPQVPLRRLTENQRYWRFFRPRETALAQSTRTHRSAFQNRGRICREPPQHTRARLFVRVTLCALAVRQRLFEGSATLHWPCVDPGTQVLRMLLVTSGKTAAASRMPLSSQ